MLPARPTAVTPALEALEKLRGSEEGARLRVALLDDSVFEGELVSLSDGHLALGTPAGMQYVPADQVRIIQRATRRTFREFLVLSGMIVGVTAALVAVERVPFLEAHLNLREVAVGLCIFTFAGIVQLQRRTRLGAWLRGWETVVEVDRQSFGG